MTRKPSLKNRMLIRDEQGAVLDAVSRQATSHNVHKRIERLYGTRRAVRRLNGEWRVLPLDRQPGQFK